MKSLSIRDGNGILLFPSLGNKRYNEQPDPCGYAQITKLKPIKKLHR
ncbi:hypothetical protein [Flavobacterium fluviatile]|nr:hypothetical protein [Flavobacterium fluviatile]